MFSTPILFIVFNKIDTTQQVFAKIRAIKPTQLFVVADGPRVGNLDDQEKCARVRQLITEGVDWDCDLKTLYREENLGCGEGPAAGINWFFSQVERGIILEDDCLPATDFFRYCALMLDKYQEDTRVMHISGHHPLEQYTSKDQLLLSKYSFIWGWASWARAWKTYDYTLAAWPTPYAKQKVKSACASTKEWKYWEYNFNKYQTATGTPTWDYQWQFALYMNDGLSVVPATPLIFNLGIGHPDATHTTQGVTPQTLPSYSFSPPALDFTALTYPATVDHTFDKRVFNEVFGLWLPTFNLKVFVYERVYTYLPADIKRFISKLRNRA